MSTPLRIGMIGLDTSHVIGFTKLLNNPEAEHHVPGGRVVAAYPGGSSDFELSWSRVEGFTTQLRDDHNVQILDRPEAVAEACDLVFINSCDGRVHLDQFRQTLGAKRPTFIDKPLATSLADAAEIFRLADETGVPVMSSSAMRYDDSLVTALADRSDPVIGCNVFGLIPEEPTQPGLFWYGIHSMELLVTVMGTGCRQVRALRSDDSDLISFVYDEGRFASIHGLRRGKGGFGLILHLEKAGAIFVDINAMTRPRYAPLLEAVLASLPEGKSAIPTDETLEVIRLIEVANESRAAFGSEVSV